MNQDPEGPDAERNESEADREDRKYDYLLQELRVIQTSAQLTAGFLLTLPFQQQFSTLSTGQEQFYLALVIGAALVIAVVLSPVAIHRQLSGLKVKGTLAAAAHDFVLVALGLVGLLVTAIVTFIFDVVVDRSSASIVGVALLVVFTGLMVVV